MLAEIPPLEGLGPAMQALSPGMRRWALEFCFNGGDAPAATKASYPKTKSPNAFRVQTHRCKHHELMGSALKEVSERLLHSQAPVAIDQLGKILRNPSSRHHVKAIEIVLNRTGFLPEKKLDVKGGHRMTIEEADRVLLAYAEKMGIDTSRMPVA